MGGVGNFLSELRRRKIWWVGGVYLAASWLIMQVIGFVEAPLRLPDWADTLAIVLLLAGLPVAIILAWAQESQATPVEGDEEVVLQPAEDLDPKGIAVLPFENLSPDPDNAYFAAGVHEEVLNQLAKIHDLNVIARTSVLPYAGSGKTIPDVATDLKVGSVMEGSVRYAGDRVRVTAQLINGATNVHLWSETYDRNLDDIFGIQSEIALAIAAELRATLSAEEAEAIERPLTDNQEAYAFYLQTQALAQRGSIDNLTSAVEWLDKAIELDGTFAAAIGQKAAMITLLHEHYGVSLMDDPLTQALELVDRALELDPLCETAYWARGAVLRNFNDWEGGLAAYRRGVELAPNNVSIRTGIALHLMAMGRYSAAVTSIERAVDLDPGGAVVHITAARIYAAGGRLEDAIREGQLSILLNKEAGGLSFHAQILTFAGRDEEAKQILKIAEGLSEPNVAGVTFQIALGWAMAGEQEHASDVMASVDLANEPANRQAAWLLHSGNRDGALDLLESAMDTTGYLPVGVISYLALTPLLKDPRYKAMMRKAGLQV